VLQQNLATAESKQHPERNGTTATEKRSFKLSKAHLIVAEGQQLQ